MDLTNDYPGFQRQGGVWASAVCVGWRDMQACRPGNWSARASSWLAYYPSL